MKIAIIGAGPAGSTCARLLSPSHQVTIFDKKWWDGRPGFMKPCGGLLAPGSQKTLRKQGLVIPESIKVHPQLTHVETFDLDHPRKRIYYRNYINVDRHRFDLWLCSLIPPHVTIRDGVVVTSIEKKDGSFHVHTLQGETKRSDTFDLIIGADGANSIVRRTFFTTKVPSYTAIQEWYQPAQVRPRYAAHFDSQLTPSYAWSDTKDGYFILGAALPSADAPQRFLELKQKLASPDMPFEPFVKREACLVNCPTAWSQIVFTTDRIALLGEAAGLVTPSSLEGISHALRSGQLLAETLNHHGVNGLSVYARRARLLKWRILRKHLKYPFMYWPWLRRFVMWTGFLSVKQ